MKKFFYLFLLFSFAINCLQSCGEAQKKPIATDPSANFYPADAATPPPMTPERAAYEKLAAFYSGNLPCQDCEGIETLLLLNADKTRSYILQEEYKGKQPKKVESNGTWSIDGDIVTMQGESGTMKYRVTNEDLARLNADGSMMDTSKYMLKKVVSK